MRTPHAWGVLLLICVLGRATSAGSFDFADALRNIASLFSTQPPTWSKSVTRAASSFPHDLVPLDAFGFDLAAQSEDFDACGLISLADFAVAARRVTTCGNATFCRQDGGFASCPVMPDAEWASATDFVVQLEAGQFDCYVPVHIVPPTSPEFSDGCVFDIVGNMVLVHAGWALEHHMLRADGSIPSSALSELGQGVQPVNRSDSGSNASLSVHVQYGRELQWIGGALPMLEARRLLFECGMCEPAEDGFARLTSGHDELWLRNK